MSSYWDEESANIRKHMQNQLAQAVGMPTPHPEHAAEMRRRHEAHEQRRAQWLAEWRARDIVDRLLALDEQFDLGGPYAEHDIADAVAEIERLREILSVYEQEADLNDESTQDLIDIINKFEALVAELLPLVRYLAEFQSPDMEFGYCTWELYPYQCDGIKVDEHGARCPVSLARDILARINAGEFKEVS